MGTHIMVGGLVYQVLSLLLFIGLAVEFALNVRRDRRTGRFQRGPNNHVGFNGNSERAFKMFLFGMLHLVQFTVVPWLTSIRSIVIGNHLHPHTFLLSSCGASKGFWKQACQRGDSVHDSRRCDDCPCHLVHDYLSSRVGIWREMEECRLDLEEKWSG